ncbi:MAG: NAD-dependent epimerase/dehydratase family protein [Candidatus Pristimantibacillus sp.]
MRIFVAGATGVVGRLLVPKLIHEGHEVIGMTHRRENKEMIEKMGAQSVIVDIFDRDNIFSILSQIQPKVVIHQLTSLSDRNFTDNTRIRIEGTRNLVDASLAAGVKQIIAQSISWAYEPGEEAAAEDIPLDVNASNPRKRTIDGVLALETAVAEIPNHVILRYGMLYGPGTWYDHKGYMAKEIVHGKVPATDGVVSFLHVEDAARAALLALNWPSGPVNIVDDEPARGVDWLPVYSQSLGALAPVKQSGREPWERGASNAKVRLDLGWNPLYPTWKSGFAQSLSSQ